MESEENILKICQKCLELVPVTVLGSGASLQYGVGGMEELKAFLVAEVKPDHPDQEAWSKFRIALAETNDLEAALQRIGIPERLERKIVSATRAFVMTGDKKVFDQLIEGTLTLTHTRLIRHLLQTAHAQVTIVTTNYDRLAEYAVDAAGVGQSTGFGGAYRRSFDSANLKKKVDISNRTVEILKVHGSLDWFADESGQQFALPDSARVPASYHPLLVTPGTGKYFTTHLEPFRSIIGRTDEVFAAARSILCVGYGFKDMHIQPKLRKRVVNDGIPIVILAKQLTPEAKNFVRDCNHAFVLGLEFEGTGARAFSNLAKEGFHVKTPIWEFEQFLKETIGG